MAIGGSGQGSEPLNTLFHKMGEIQPWFSITYSESIGVRCSNVGIIVKETVMKEVETSL